ncbi:UNVERIFIED_CONTAM: hypothetical protein K2H54_018043 [Gekko kuhli]
MDKVLFRKINVIQMQRYHRRPNAGILFACSSALKLWFKLAFAYLCVQHLSHFFLWLPYSLGPVLKRNQCKSGACKAVIKACIQHRSERKVILSSFKKLKWLPEEQTMMAGRAIFVAGAPLHIK